MDDLVDWLRRIPLWKKGLVLVAAGLVLFAEQHWLSPRAPSHLALAPMVSLEQFGGAAVALGVVVVAVGLVQAARDKRTK
jgi:hypothetical protein